MLQYTPDGYFPDSKVHAANMGPTLGQQEPGGPHVGPMNLACWVGMNKCRFICAYICVKLNVQIIYQFFKKFTIYTMQFGTVLAVGL